MVMGLLDAGMSFGDLCALAPELLAGEPTMADRAPPPFLDGPADGAPTMVGHVSVLASVQPPPAVSPMPTRTRRRSAEATPSDAPPLEDVDLAHACAPEVPAATHQCPAGNMTPMRIHVSRPGFTVPAQVPVPSWDVLGCKAATVRHIPAGVQTAWCRAQAAALDRFCDSPSEATLWGVLAMPKLVLRQVPLKGRHAKAHLADIMINRILAFERGDWASLWTSLERGTTASRGRDPLGQKSPR